MSHAEFSPSNSKRWLTCTASMALPKVEEKQSAYANRGTALHAMADDILNKKEIQESYEGYVPTEEDVACTVQPYVDYINAIDVDHRFYEQKVFLTEDCNGTADFIGFNSKTKTLHVADLKAGKGVFVKVENNTQLQIYAIGAIEYIENLGPIVERVVTHIVQPGIDNICSMEIPLETLALLKKDVLKSVEDVRSGNVKYEASEDGCRWCQHKTTCPHLKGLTQKIAQEEFEDLELSDSLKLVPVLKLFIKAIEEKSLEVLNQGKKLEGFKLARTRGTRIFSDLEEVRTALGAEGVREDELFHERKPFTVPQTEKYLKTAKIDFDLSEFIKVKEGSPKVVPEKSLSKKINKTEDAQQVFKNI